MDSKKAKEIESESQRDSKMDDPETDEKPPQHMKVEEDTAQTQSVEELTTTMTTGSFSSNELWWSILPFSRARRLWLVLRAGLYRLVERMKRAEMQVAHLTHGLESLRRLEVPAGLMAVAQDMESKRLVLLDAAGQLYLHAEDGWARGQVSAPVELTGLVALVGFQYLGQNPGRFVGWGPEGMVVLNEDLQLLSRNFLDPSCVPSCCVLLPGKGMVIIGEEGGGLSMWEFRGGGRRLVLIASFPALSSHGESYALSRMALDVAPRGVFPRCYAVCGPDLHTYDLATCSIIDVRRKLHKTLISDVVYCDATEVVVTASRDSTVKVWDADWQIRNVFVGHTGPVTALAVLPGSALVLSASQDMTLRTWNLEIAQQVGEVSLRNHADTISGVRQDTIDENEMPLSSNSLISNEVCNLWPPVRPGAPVVAQGLTFVELWVVRELHQPLVTLNSHVQSLELAPPLPQSDREQLPLRIVVKCADGSVRIFSAVSGKMISALLLAPGEMAAAAAYCLPREVMLVLTHEGVLLRANAARYPMNVVRRLQPPQPSDPQPTCLHLISHIVDSSRAYGIWENIRARGGELRKKSWLSTTWEDKNRFLPVLGYTDGTIAVLDWQSFRKLFHTQAHSPGSTTIIASSLQSLVTSGTDMTIKIWQIFPYSEESLTLLRTFFCYQSTVALCPLGSCVNVAFEDPCSATYSVVQYGTSDCSEMRNDHQPQDDPTDHITGLCCCPYLKLYASSSLDCTLRIWTQDNKLLRLMHLNMAPEAITFCNDKGDLILAHGSHLCLVSHKLYLPTSYLVKVVCRKMQRCKDDPPLPMTDPELLSPEELKRLKGLQTISKVRMKHVVKQQYRAAESRQLEIEEACARLAVRDEELRNLALGQVEPLTQMILTPQLRTEAFHNYLQVIYGSRLDNVSKEENEALNAIGSDPVEKKPLSSPVSQSDICQKLGLDIDALFMQGVTSTKSPRMHRIRKRTRVPLSKRILEPCSSISGFFPSSKTQLRRPSTQSKEMPPPIQFPGYIPNSVSIQQLWPKEDLKGVGEPIHLMSETFAILECDMDSVWLPWGKSRKKEKAFLKKALEFSSTLTQDTVQPLDPSLLQMETFPVGDKEEDIVSEELLEKESEKEVEEKIKEVEKEQVVPEVTGIPDLHFQMKEYVSSLYAPETRDPASVFTSTSDSGHIPGFIFSLLNQNWFQRFFPDFNLQAYPECNTVEGLATLLLIILEKCNWEDGTHILLVLIELIPQLGMEFRKKLHCLLLKLLNKDPPPHLVDKLQKKFVMTALKVLTLISLGSRDVVLELMSYFLYSPPWCRPMLKKLLEDMGLKDPHNFLVKEMVTWAKGKHLTTKAALRGHCGQKLESLIHDLKTHVKQEFLENQEEELREKVRMSISFQERQSRDILSSVLPTTKTELSHLKFPHPPTPAPSAQDKTIFQSRPQPPYKRSLQPSPQLSPQHSPKHSLQHSPKHSSNYSPTYSPYLPTILPSSSPHFGLSPEIPTIPESRDISTTPFRLLSISQPSLLRRGTSEAQWQPTFEKDLKYRHSAPASRLAGWLSFLDMEYPIMQSSVSTTPSLQEFEIDVTPIDALNFFCEQKLHFHTEHIKMQKDMHEVRPNTIVMQPPQVLSTYHSIQGRKILRLQEHKSSLTAMDGAGTTNFERTRCRMGAFSHSLKLPLPRVEPIPFPPTWPPLSRPLPPLILEDSLQRYFLPNLTLPSEDYH